jgi:hypothetical protein
MSADGSLGPWRTMPAAPLSSTIAETALDWSVSIVTCAPFDVTSVTRPTSPSSVTTGSFRSMPEPVPAAISISWSYAVGGLATTVVATPR